MTWGNLSQLQSQTLSKTVTTSPSSAHNIEQHKVVILRYYSARSVAFLMMCYTHGANEVVAINDL